RRARENKAGMDGLHAQYGTVHFDAARDAQTYDPQMWGAERLHPSGRGPRPVAPPVPGPLAGGRHPVGAEPSADPENPPPGRLAVAGWLATKGTAWVVRRSTDLVPALVAMAWAEYRSGGGDGGEGSLAVDPLAAAQPPVAQEA